MITKSTGSTSELQAAQASHTEAAAQLHVHEVAARLRARRGLHYASIGPDPHLGPHLVVHDGAIIGTVWTTSPGALCEWFARPLDSDSERELGPFPTARSAAAGLLP